MHQLLPVTTCFPLGTLAKVDAHGRGWERPRCTWCLVQGVSGLLVVPLHHWCTTGGPPVPGASGIVTNIPSLGHTKSPTECPSVSVPAVFFWRALLLTQLMDDLAISLFHLMVICFRQIFLNYTYRLVFHW